MKVTLQVNGREETYTEDELVVIILESRSSNEATETESATMPTEGKVVEVNPTAINRQLFQEGRNDTKQEMTRQLILEAFVEVDANPEKYGRSFKTLMPKKTWSSKDTEELKNLAQKMGDHMADRVEQALEWAQRIDNGESWNTVCNDKDTANWYRAIFWLNHCAMLVGGSVSCGDDNPPSYVNMHNYNGYINFFFAVPLVVLY